MKISFMKMAQLNLDIYSNPKILHKFTNKDTYYIL
jgi:hypothetical protein